MAKLCSVNKNNRRKRMIESKRASRQALKSVIMNKDTSPEERMQAVLKLAKMPRNSSKVRHRNRCALTGRPRGVYAKFNLCRVKIRDLAGEGQIPGLVKASW